MGWKISQPFAFVESLAQLPWTGKVPVVSVMFCIAPGWVVLQAHLSAFSFPMLSSHPPEGSWSVMVSAYSCPFTMEKPSSSPALPELTKFSPHELPMSVT